MAPRKPDNMPARNKKNFRPTKKGAGMTKAGVAAYRKKNPGSKLKTAVTGKVKPGSKAAKRRMAAEQVNNKKLPLWKRILGLFKFAVTGLGKQD